MINLLRIVKKYLGFFSQHEVKSVKISTFYGMNKLDGIIIGWSLLDISTNKYYIVVSVISPSIEYMSDKLLIIPSYDQNFFYSYI